MNSAKAFLIVLQHSPDLFSPIEKCKLSLVCTESDKIIESIWKHSSIKTIVHDKPSIIITKCSYCTKNNSKKDVVFLGRCNACIKTIQLITETQAKKEFFVNGDLLDLLPSLSRRHRLFRTQMTLYLRKDVINAALIFWKGPKALLKRINKRNIPSKTLQLRVAKVEELKSTIDKTSWDLCVVPFLNNGKGGIREVHARLYRLQKWSEFNSLATKALRYEYLEEFISSDNGMENVTNVLNRYNNLVDALAEFGLDLYSDSILCYQYIRNGTIQTLDGVVETMKQMNWLQNNTEYSKRLNDTYGNIADDIFRTYGWIENNNMYMRIFNEYKQTASISLCNKMMTTEAIEHMNEYFSKKMLNLLRQDSRFHQT